MPTKAPTPCPACHTLGTCTHRTRPSAHQRGYNAQHRAARQAIAATLPAPCGGCGKIIRPTDRWHTAHVIDGDPRAGWVPAHPACNEAMKDRSR